MMGLLILLVFLLAVPAVIGIAGEKMLINKRKSGMAESYLWGNIILWALFQMLCVPMAMLGISFTVFSMIYLGIIISLTVLALTKYRQYMILKAVELKQEIRKFSWQEILLIIIVAVQILILVFGVTYEASADDASYIALSLDTLSSDRIAQLDPYTGLEGAISLKRLLTSWNFYISFLGKISGIHVAVIAHTILPILLVPMAYMAYFLIGRAIFGKNRKRTVQFLLWLSLLFTFGAYSVYTVTYRLTIVVWQGKAVMVTIILPFLFCFLIKMKEIKFRKTVCLFLIMASACSMSLMGVGLSVFMVMISAVAKLKRHKVKAVVPLLLTCTLISMVAVYYLWKRGAGILFSPKYIAKLFPQAVTMIREAFSLYWNGSKMLWLYLCGFLIICWRGRKKRNVRFLIKYTLISYIIIWNPVFYYFAFVFLKNASVGVRLIYTMFPEVYMALAMTLLTCAFRDRKGSMIAGWIGGLYILLTGTIYPKVGHPMLAENTYKLPQEAIQVCQILNEDSEEPPLVMADGGLVLFLRQYSSRVKMLYGRFGYIYNGEQIFQLINEQRITKEEIWTLLEENNCDYVVWKNNDADVEAFTQLGGELVDTTQNYAIIKKN